MKKVKSKISSLELSKLKFFGFVILFTAATLVLIGRLFYLQIIKYDHFKSKAKNTQLIQIPVKPNRGRIFDTKGNELVTNTKSLKIAVDPNVFGRMTKKNELKKKANFINLLSSITKKPKSFYLNKIADTNLRYVILEKEINILHKPEFRDLDMFGLLITENSERIYPHDNVASHILGFTNSDGLGISGLELQFDSVLSGVPGYIILKRDLKRDLHAGAELPSFPSKDGNNLYLTIDMNLQSIVEYELAQGIANFSADAGSVIVMNPFTGEILALASYPSFNPNILYQRRSEWVRNRAINDEYEPGSIFKMITAAAALEEGLVSPNQMFSGFGGAMKVGSYTIRDVHPLGNITFRQAVEQSSNVVFAQVATRIPHKTFYKYIRDFGFGLLTDIELPGEARGRIPKPIKLTSTLQKYVGFGYGISTTPLQMLCSYSAIANGGNLIKPYLVKSIVDNSGNTLFQAKTKVIRKVVSKNTSDMIKDLFYGVIERGTGKSVRINNLQIAGKTGTSQQLVNGSYSKAHYNASFVGFFPVDNPKVAMIVVLDNPKGVYYGGATSAPIFKNIALRMVNSSDFW